MVLKKEIEAESATYKNYIKSIPIKQIIFYLIIFSYMVWGTISTYNFICDYKELQQQPRTLFTLYILKGKYLFVKPILISLILNGVLVFYLVKYVAQNRLIKYVIIFLTASICFTFMKDIGFFSKSNNDYFTTLERIFYAGSYILFSSRFAVQNLTIFSLFVLLLFPLHKKLYANTIISKHKFICLIIALIINFLIIMWLFPQYWLGITTL